MTATAGRPDYDAGIKLATLTPEEPIFVLRAGDICAPAAVRAWAALAHEQGAPVEAIELALQQADRMEVWPSKKVPNGPDLTEDQRKQLRYQHGRRAWVLQGKLGSEDMLLSAQLGRAQVMGRVRPLVIALLDAIIQEGLTPTRVGLAHQALAELVAFASCGTDKLLEAVSAGETAD